MATFARIVGTDRDSDCTLDQHWLGKRSSGEKKNTEPLEEPDEVDVEFEEYPEDDFDELDDEDYDDDEVDFY
jgi:hypothetical protein